MFLTHLHYPQSVYCALENAKQGFPVQVLDYADVAFVQRQTTLGNLKAAQEIKRRGLKYIYDLDDNLWHVPKFNQAKGYFETQIKGTLDCMKLADHVTVSTNHLAVIVRRKVGRELHCPVTVVENAIDLSLFSRSRRQKNDGQVIIGWAGTNTHSVDISLIVGTLVSIMRGRKQVIVEFMGGDFPFDRKTVEQLGSERFRYRKWVPIEKWPAFCSNLPWDISLAPLTLGSFNESKSNVKSLEAGALGIPCVASATAEYKRFCQNHPLLQEATLCYKPADWQEKLLRLIDSEQKRVDIGALARKRVEERYNIEQRVNEWAQVFEA